MASDSTHHPPMTRPTRYKLGYALALLLLAGLALTVLRTLGGVAAAVVAIALLIPGRIVGALYRDLFRARRLLDRGEPEASIPCTLRFLEWIRANPARKRMLWLAWSAYTPDAEAMALNNLGAAYLETGAPDAAASALRSALAVDPRYPLPYYNLAMASAVADDHAEAARLLAEADRLGFRGTAVDRLISDAQSLLARIEGRGLPKPAP